MKKRLLPALLTLLLTLCLVPTALAVGSYYFDDDSDNFSRTLAGISQSSNNFSLVSEDPLSTESDSVERSCTLNLCSNTLSVENLTIKDGVTFTVKGTSATFTVTNLTFSGSGTLVIESDVTATVANIPSGCFYRTGSEGSYNYTTSQPASAPFAVLPCPHDYENETCTICRTPCAHPSKDDTTGKCTTCEKQYIIKDNYGNYYENTSDIADKISTLLCDLNQGFKLTDTDATLDLNGHAINGTITVDKSYENSCFTLKDTKGTGFVSEIKVTGGSKLFISGGHVGTLTLNSAQAELTGGTFDKIEATRDTLLDFDLLPEGYVFQSTVDNSYPTLAADQTVLEKVKVVPCPHSTISGGECTLCGGVPYLDENGDLKCIYSDYYIAGTSLGSNKWCYVMYDTVFDSNVTISSELNVILRDGCTLTFNQGLEIESGGSLTIYGQPKGTGKLVARGGSTTSQPSGITSYINYGIWAGGPLTINGGQITAVGFDLPNNGYFDNYSYGIYSGSTITLNDGTLTATGGTVSGGHSNSSLGMNVQTLTVNGGTLTASAGQADYDSIPLSAYAINAYDRSLKLPVGSYVAILTVSGSMDFADLLADGCAYQLDGNNGPAKLEELPDPLRNVYIVTHDHEYGEDEKCVYCGKNKPKESKYAITLTTPNHGTLSSDGKKAQAGKTVTLTVTPDEGYELESLTVLTTKGRELDLIDNEDGTYSFTMPRSAVTVEATFAEIEVEPEPEPTPSPSFSDVPPDSWFAPAGSWAVEKGITTGTSAATFAPTLSCTRAELVTFLWRAAGSPEANGSAPFDDVPANAYYAAAVAWCFENNLVKGCGNNQFCPDNVISRQESVTLLYRYAAAYLTLPSAPPSTPLSPSACEDIEEVANWAQEAVLWAVNSGLLQGFANKIMPNAPCSRSEILTLLFRLFES